MNTYPGTPKLDTCGCCEAEVPKPKLYNRPSLSALAYRVGTHSTFMARMLARLPAQLIPDGPTLIDLTTRSRDDLSIAMLDAWATVADVLTFYQERIANESYLRTATERRSVLELARAIGYELNPGVAASTYLAFTVEDVEGAPGRATIDKGVKILSIPGQDERPQTFEPIEKIEARAEWNSMRPRQSKLEIPRYGSKEVFLKGVETGLKPGDPLLFIGRERREDAKSERWDFRRISEVSVNRTIGYTRVRWKEGLGWARFGRRILPAAKDFAVYSFRQRAALFGHNAPDWRAMPDSVKKGFLGRDPVEQDKEWPGFNLDSKDTVNLDAVYSQIIPGSWVVLSVPNYEEVYDVVDVEEESVENFTLTAKVTRLKLRGENLVEKFGQSRRDTTVFAQSEQLEMAEKPLTLPVFGSEIVLDQLLEGLEQGRVLAVSGKLATRVQVARSGADLRLISEDEPPKVRRLREDDLLEIVEPPLVLSDGSIKWHLEHESGTVGYVTAQPDDLIPEPASEEDETINEIAFIARLSDDEERTTLTLRSPLRNAYDRTTVVINANVAAATHGETVNEVLGSGDGAQANQRFQLKKPPLTYISAPTPSGGESTLVVRVNEVEWEEVPSLYGLDARSQSYAVRLDDSGTPTVIFGDGQSGARLPSGAENVKATYRSGIGPDGAVTAKSLTLMQTRPHGVREVTNPVAATGAAAPEALEAARSNAPLTVLTLERIVSLQDFEDFSRAFAGIGKAQAVALWDGETRLVHITVASASGDPVDPTSTPILYQNLSQAIDNVRDPVQEVRIDDYQRLEFKIEAALLIDSRYIREKVHAKVHTALREAFAFEKRALSQPVTATEIVALIQKVAGVVATALKKLYLVGDDESQATLGADFSSRLPAKTARREDDEIKPAQLLLLASDGVTLEDME